MRLVQFVTPEGRRQVGAILNDGAQPVVVKDATSVRELALEAARSDASLEQLISARGGVGEVDYDEIVAEKRLLLPLDHAEPSRCTISVTGLTHLGSAESR